MRRVWQAMILAAAAGLARPAAAHPHVFIDTTVTAILDRQGRLTAVRLRWDYDSLLSMVVIGDKGADADMDGRISPSEAVVLDGFDMAWIEGFDGDTSLFQDETRLALQKGPQDWATGWIEDEAGGHLWSEHTRRLVDPVDPADGPVSIVVYDVSDYTAYALTGAGLRADDPAAPVAQGCRIGPPLETEAEDGFLATLGLFVFGSDDEAAAGSIIPAAAPNRIVAILSCD